MLGHDAEKDKENSDTIPKKIMKAGREAEEDEENPDTILEKTIKSGHDVGELEIKKLSNLGTMPENQKKKGNDRIWA